MVTASMAFLPERVNADVTNSIRRQVDMFHQYKGDNELGDANKFRGVIGKKGYCFTVDDDLIYPENYVEYMIEKIEKYDRKAVITLHGKIILNQPISSFYGSDFLKLRCLDKVSKDIPVHIPGTGVMGWHSDTIQFSMNDFPKPNMADIWAGIKCETEGVQRICAKHDAGWLKHISNKTDLYRQNRSRDKLLTDTINSIEWTS